MQSVYSCVRLHDMKTDMKCVVQSKVWSELGLAAGTWSVDQEFQNFSGWRKWCWNDRWRGNLGEPSPDEDDFEKQMRLVNESDKTAVRTSPSQTQVDQLEGWLLEKPIPLSRMTTSVRKAFLIIGIQNCQVTIMWSQRTQMSLGCGDSSMVVLDLEAG